MNEIDILRKAWEQPAPPPPATRQAARAALLTAAATGTAGSKRTVVSNNTLAGDAGNGRRRGRKVVVRLVAAGVGAAAVVVAGLAVTQAGGQAGKAKGILPGRKVALASVSEVLGKAADAALTQPYTVPRQDQWVYMQTLRRLPDKRGPHTVQGPNAPLHTMVDKVWVRGDGLKVALYDQGQLQVTDYGGGASGMPQDYARLMALPKDPAGMLAWARNASRTSPGEDTPDSAAFGLLSGMLYDSLLPPKVEGTLFRAMALIPGVRVNPHAADLQGRAAIAVDYVDGWRGRQILLDPRTYIYEGERDVAVATYSSPVDGWKILKGQILVLITREKAGIVDKPGQLPR